MHDEIVNGIVVGPIHCVGVLTYRGRPQGNIMYRKNFEVLLKSANKKLNEYKRDPAFSLIYPDDAWSVKILQE